MSFGITGLGQLRVKADQAIQRAHQAGFGVKKDQAKGKLKAVNAASKEGKRLLS